MSDDFDEALDRLTMEQRRALATILHAAMTADSIRKQAAQKPGEVAFTVPVRDMLKTPDTDK